MGGFFLKQSVRNPIIFIPGIMGSMGSEIIPGTGKWKFGVAKWIYEPLIKGLEKLGYELEKDLFICFYDWRCSNTYSSKEFLLPMIEKVKKDFENNKVDIIAHSMGGLVARTYIQSNYNKKEIDKFIMIATPNKGALDAYYFWSQGEFLSGKNRKKSHQQLLSRGYIWLLQKLMNFSLGIEYLDRLHELFPSVNELIPSYDYGAVLCYRDENDIITIPTFYLKHRNVFLDQLNFWGHLLKYGTQNTFCIVGNSFDTGQRLIIDKYDFFYSVEERIIDVVYTAEGDGTVTCKSAQLDGVNYYMLNNNHQQIVESALKPLSEIYNYQYERKQEQILEIIEYNCLHLLLEGKANVNIRNKSNNEVLLVVEDERIYTAYDYIYEKYNQLYSWIVIKNVPKGEYFINITELELKGVNALIMTERRENEYSTFLNKNKTLEIQVF